MEDNSFVPFQPPKLDEAEIVMLREFFSQRHGQRFLQLVRSWRPSISATAPEERHMQLERRLGYEECFDHMLQILRPKEQQVAPKTL